MGPLDEVPQRRGMETPEDAQKSPHQRPNLRGFSMFDLGLIKMKRVKSVGFRTV